MTDPFNDPQSNFITAKDFDGRLCVVKPTGVEHDIPSTMPGAEGKTYHRVIADVHVLDGPANDKFNTIPFVAKDQYLAGSGLVPQLTRPIGDGKLKPGGLTVGRFGLRKGKFPQPAVVLTPCPVGTPDRAKAAAYWDEYSRNLDPFAAS